MINFYMCTKSLALYLSDDARINNINVLHF
jgi:hypothetical protein